MNSRTKEKNGSTSSSRLIAVVDKLQSVQQSMTHMETAEICSSTDFCTTEFNQPTIQTLFDEKKSSLRSSTGFILK